MYKHQDDIDLLEKLDKKRYQKCVYCDQKSVYTQPEKDTGIIIEVCEKHFSYKYFG